MKTIYETPTANLWRAASALALLMLTHSGWCAGPAGLSDTDWANLRQQAYIKASNTETQTNRQQALVNEGDWFGGGVARSRNTLVVSAPKEASNATGVNGNQDNNDAPFSGAVYVFVREGTNWMQQAYLKASNTGAGDNFGWGLAISGDTIVVGAPYEASNASGVNGNQNNNSALGSGAAYVFVRQGTNWTQQAYLKASNPGGSTTGPFYDGDAFGLSVAIFGDTIVVGAVQEDSNARGVNGNQNNNAALDSGAAYVFVRDGTNWLQQAYLKASNTGPGDVFGGSVAVWEDTIIIGASGEASSARGVNGNQNNELAPGSGAAYVFARNGTNWSQQAYLKASNTDGDDRFGSSVAMWGDRAVIGAWQESSRASGVNGNQADNSAWSAGAAYVFVRDGTNWAQEAYLKASNPGGGTRATLDPGDIFGVSVAVYRDAIIVGATAEDSNATGVNGNQSNNAAPNSGAAYLFVRNGTNWSQRAYLKASNTGGDLPAVAGFPIEGDTFGFSVAIGEDTIAVGAFREGSNSRGINGDQANNLGLHSGAAYVFTAPAILPPELRLTAARAGANLHLTATALSGRAYTLQSSETLTNWTDLTTRTAITNRIDFTDAPTNAPARRFYRVKQD